MLPKQSTVRLLTGKTSEDRTKLRRQLAEFRQEYSAFDVRFYRKPHELHDRYLLTNDYLLIVGHGLKDIGRKESFVVIVTRALVPDMLGALKANFDNRWHDSEPI